MNPRSLALIAALLLPAAASQAAGMCESLCASEKKVCVREADQDARMVVDPLIPAKANQGMPRNPNQLPPESTQESREQKHQILQKSRSELTQKCDVQAQQCIAACQKKPEATDRATERSIEKVLENKKLAPAKETQK